MMNFDPQLRRQVLEKALAHSSLVWVLRQHGSPNSPDLAILNARARILAELPKKSLVRVMHRTDAGKKLHGMLNSRAILHSSGEEPQSP
jgi:hypothetical protein